MKDSIFESVLDTAFWVANFRAIENKRENGLFKDPYAELLVSGGKELKKSFDSDYVAWTVILRTVVIDEMIKKYTIDGEVDAVINLGAGLDARPYRLDLPDSLYWIEVDQAKIIDHKERVLAKYNPKCHLERYSLDLSLLAERFEFLKDQNEKYSNILVLTEGVLPYLTGGEVGDLALELRELSNCKKWIAEYHSSEMYKHLRNKRKDKEMGEAEFKFFPSDWLDFFYERGWREKELIYLLEEGGRLNRPFPMPWWAKIIYKVLPKSELEKFQKMVGFAIFEKVESEWLVITES